MKMKKEMLYFGRGFLPSTLFLFLLPLSIAVFDELPITACKNIQYNPHVFDATPIQQPFEDRICTYAMRDWNGGYYSQNVHCNTYVCKVNTTIYFGQGCIDESTKFCNVPNRDFRIGRFQHRDLYKPEFLSTSFKLYKKYMEEVKPFGNDSMQEGLFWLEVSHEWAYTISWRDRNFYAEKASAYLSTNLQSFTSEIRNSEINVKEKVEEKVKEVLQMAIEPLFRYLQDVQNAANQSLPETEYFQSKYAELEAKMEVYKMCADNILKPYLIKSNEILRKVETEMKKAQEETHESIRRLHDHSLFEEYHEIQANILQSVSSNKEKVSDFLKLANELTDKISCIGDDEIGYFQFVGRQARQAMENSETEEEFKVLIRNVQMKNEEVNKKMDSISRDFKDVQKAANQHSLPENEYFQKKFAEMEAIKACARTWNETVLQFVDELNDTLEKRAARLKETLESMNVIKENVDIIPSLSERQEAFLREFSESKENFSMIAKLLNESINSFACLDDDEIGYFQSAGYEARKEMEDFESEKEFKDLIKEIKDAVEAVKKVGESAQKTADKAQAIVDESNMLITNAENSAKNANETAEESKIMAKEAQAVAEDANNIAKESSAIGKDAKNEFDHEMEALRSNGRKRGGFIGATLIILFFV